MTVTKPDTCKPNMIGVIRMNDLISRQAAIDGVKTLHDVAWNNWHEPTLSANVVLDMIRELPSAQPEIIHCLDCKHFGVDRYKKLTWCSRINYGYGYQADDFCSKAERRTNGV